MSRWARRTWLVLTPALLLSVALMGCGGDKEKEKTGDEKASAKKAKGKEKGPVAGGPQAIKAGNGTITGKVTLDGEVPTTLIKKLNEELQKKISMNKNSAECLQGADESEKTQSSWVIGKDKGVANVFVWIKPVDDTTYFFDVSELVKEKKGYKPALTLNQPHCAFQPHALLLFPVYMDPKNPSDDYEQCPSTGQVFKVISTAKIAHNTKTSISAPGGAAINLTIPKEGHTMTKANVLPSYKAPIKINCSIHEWMEAYAWSFPHPFAAITDEKGNYTIENVPTGVKVRIVAWHEKAEWLNGDLDGKEIELKEGTNKQDFKVPAPE